LTLTPLVLSLVLLAMLVLWLVLLVLLAPRLK
jgi:hypothetical protein